MDRLLRGLLPEQGLRVVFARVADTARMARVLHGLYPTSAHLFAEAAAGGLLVAALQKEGARVNLQVECDGPLRAWRRIHGPADAHPAVRVEMLDLPRQHFGTRVRGGREHPRFTERRQRLLDLPGGERC